MGDRRLGKIRAYREVEELLENLLNAHRKSSSARLETYWRLHACLWGARQELHNKRPHLDG